MEQVKEFFADISKFRWALPLVMLFAGYFIPDMRAPIGWPTSEVLWAGIVVSLILVTVWIVAEVITTVDRRTPVAALQRDDGISLLVALAITFAAGAFWRNDQLGWWFIIPWVGTMIDATLAGTLGINNAAQKPIMHGQS